jgi:hypothetical protein
VEPSPYSIATRTGFEPVVSDRAHLSLALLLLPGLGRGGGIAGVILLVVVMALRIFLRSRRGPGGWGGSPRM